MNSEAQPLQSPLTGDGLRFHQLADAMVDVALILLTPENRIAAWNKGAHKLLGWSEPEIVGQSGELIFTPEDRASGAARAEIEKALQDETTPDERWHVRKDGTRFWGSGVLAAIKEGTLLGFVKVLRDLTGQKLAQQRVEDSEARLRDTFRSAAVGMAITNLAGRFVDANPSFCRISGRTLKQLRKVDFLSITHPEDRSQNRTAVQRLVRGEIPSFWTEKRYVLPDGSLVWVRNSVSPVRDSEGNPREFIVLSEDISARIEAETLAGRRGRTRAKDLEALTARLVKADDDNRRQLAYLLHEEAAQQLAVVRMESDSISSDLTQILARTEALKKLTDTLGLSLRELAYSLYPPTLEGLGLDITLRRMAAEFEASLSHPVEYVSLNVPGDIPLPLAVALYRLTQEAIRNLAAGSPDSPLSVTLRGNGSSLELRIAGSGGRYIQANHPPRKRVWLTAIRERVRVLGGRIRINTRDQSAREIAIVVPLAGPHHQVAASNR